jgi:hypothetical protein
MLWLGGTTKLFISKFPFLYAENPKSRTARYYKLHELDRYLISELYRKFNFKTTKVGNIKYCDNKDESDSDDDQFDNLSDHKSDSDSESDKI